MHNRPLSGNPLSDLPPDLARRVESEVRADERLVWVGQPRPELYARAGIFLAVAGVFFTGISVMALFITLGMGAVSASVADEGLLGLPFLCFGLFAVPFILVGVLLLTAPLWMRKQAARVVYALTDRRAIVWEPSLFGAVTVRSYTADGLGQTARVENADGSGSLIFQEDAYRDSHGRHHTRQRGFLHIADVRGVEDLLRQTLLK